MSDQTVDCALWYAGLTTLNAYAAVIVALGASALYGFSNAPAWTLVYLAGSVAAWAPVALVGGCVLVADLWRGGHRDEWGDW